ncbi:uncharacterized protein TRIADDRAFT_24556 [Trichoplax adhaerens]|uniref:B30.2/SPRY domain-containing protein n=1 Tax=Trichoplax adhaerens TaxID=10228 RepID=B3RV98_TRIAD|nr:hypothetical protein TRIADDRAFT_24556 [Trichoplax adhaerens]EDV25956.1 hypothetical protein TRIADDRAFT_24556 [Trichoplax adhaerens]|eukprot:XP_002111989.1 hypothetical protein TRIADDRAFT_24556 [Trichoplax adhaerens]
MSLTKGGWQRSKIAKAIPPDRISQLYPNVDESLSPLPRAWSPRERCQFIILSQDNLRVQYRGNNTNKPHKDAASVRATYPISPACGIYYYEVKIVSKGKDGYIGIGLSVHNSNLNRLPGWEKHTFGYHGDDGHSFNSQSQGDPYGPTFTTGDVIGCGINFIHNTCFYTKNGRNLGMINFCTTLRHDLYPTVGMQTNGEIVDTNFGQEPFLYNIEDEIQETRMKVSQSVLSTPITSEGNSVQAMLHKVIIDYLVHHGYSATCETFATITGQSYKEETASIENRQKIQALIMDGKISEAICLTEKNYPTILSNKPWLHIRLLVRQFIEAINGSDTVSCSSANSTSANSINTNNNTLASSSNNDISQG